MSKNEISLYIDYLSQPSRTVLIFMKLLKVPYKVIPIELVKGDHLKPEFMKINPFHQVPFINHDDFILTESPAIVKYLLNCYDHDDHWYPKDPKRRAMVDELISNQHTTIRKSGVRACMACVFTPMMSGKPVDETERDNALKALQDSLTAFEGYFLKSGPFIAGDEISIADVFALTEISQGILTGTDYLADHSKIKEWAERTKAAIQPQYDEACAPFYKFAKENVSSK